MMVDGTRPAVGEPAPEFELTAEDGEVVRSRGLLGRRYLLYFYAKDDSPGCTAQACGLRDAWGRIGEAGLEIFGVSPDTVDSHRRFREKHGLPFRLLADPDHRTAEAYGVWAEKRFAGRRFMGNERTSFVIGADGRIEAVLPQVKPDQHVDLVLGAVSA